MIDDHDGAHRLDRHHPREQPVAVGEARDRRAAGSSAPRPMTTTTTRPSRSATCRRNVSKSMVHTEPSPPASFTARTSPVRTTTTARPSPADRGEPPDLVDRRGRLGPAASSQEHQDRHEAADPHAGRGHVHRLDGLLQPGRDRGRRVTTSRSGRGRDDAGHAQEDEPPTGRRDSDRDRCDEDHQRGARGATRRPGRSSDDRRSPRETPSEDRSANSIVIAPAAAKPPAASEIDRRPGMSPDRSSTARRSRRRSRARCRRTASPCR